MWCLVHKREDIHLVAAEFPVNAGHALDAFGNSF